MTHPFTFRTGYAGDRLKIMPSPSPWPLDLAWLIEQANLLGKGKNHREELLALGCALAQWDERIEFRVRTLVTGPKERPRDIQVMALGFGDALANLFMDSNWDQVRLRTLRRTKGLSAKDKAETNWEGPEEICPLSDMGGVISMQWFKRKVDACRVLIAPAHARLQTAQMEAQTAEVPAPAPARFRL